MFSLRRERDYITLAILAFLMVLAAAVLTVDSIFLFSFAAFMLMVQTIPAGAQWLDRPTPGTPRKPDGKPDLTAPAPRAPDGKTDFTGIWRAHHVAIVPESHETMAFSERCLPNSQATTCGFIGLSIREP